MNVPREPTQEMLEAAASIVVGFTGEYGSYNIYCDDSVAIQIWEAMYDAALKTGDTK